MVVFSFYKVLLAIIMPKITNHFPFSGQDFLKKFFLAIFSLFGLSNTK